MSFVVITACVDTGCNVACCLPNEDLYETREEANFNISDANGGSVPPAFMGGVQISFMAFSKQNLLKAAAPSIHNETYQGKHRTLMPISEQIYKKKRSKFQTEIQTKTSTDRELMDIRLRNEPGLCLTEARDGTRLSKVQNMFRGDPYVISTKISGTCSRGKTALISAAFINQVWQMRLVVETEMPRLELMDDPMYVVPLLFHNGLYLMPLVVRKPCCADPNCQNNLQTDRWKLPSTSVVKTMLANCNVATAKTNASSTKGASMSDKNEIANEASIVEFHTPFWSPAKVPKYYNNRLPKQVSFSGDSTNENPILSSKPEAFDRAIEQYDKKNRINEMGIRVQPSAQKGPKHYEQTRRINFQTAHDLFGHQGITPQRIKATLNSGAVKGLEFVNNGEPFNKFDCRGCIANLRLRPSFKESTNPIRQELVDRPIKAWETASMDYRGPFPSALPGGEKWLQLWTCTQGSGDWFPYAVKTKDEAWKGINAIFLYLSENGLVMQELRTDSDSTFISKRGHKPVRFEKELAKSSLKFFGRTCRHITTLHKSQNNQPAEAKIGWIMKGSNSLIQRAMFGPRIWWQAVQNYRCTSRCLLDFGHWHVQRHVETPYQIVTGRIPVLYNEQVFGVTMYPVRPDSKSKQMVSRLEDGLIYYLRTEDKGHRVFLGLNAHSHTIKAYTHAWFDVKSLDTRYNALLNLSEKDAQKELTRRANRARKALEEVHELPPDKHPKDVFVIDKDLYLIEANLNQTVGSRRSIQEEHLDSTPASVITHHGSSGNLNSTTLPRIETPNTASRAEPIQEYYEGNEIIGSPLDSCPFNLDNHTAGSSDEEEDELTQLNRARKLRQFEMLTDKDVREEQRKGREDEVPSGHGPAIRDEVKQWRKVWGNSDADYPLSEESSTEDGSFEDEVSAMKVPKKPPKTRRSPRDHEKRPSHKLPKNLIGSTIEKRFHDAVDYYKGKVISYDKSSGWYRVKYEDGDEEDMTKRQVETHLIQDENTNPIIVVPGQSLVEAKSDYIIHQTNCMQGKAGGVAAAIFERFEKANPCDGVRTPGTIDYYVHRHIDKTKTIIVNMNAQYEPGSPRGAATQRRMFEQRLKWFDQCLVELRNLIKSKLIGKNKQKRTVIAAPFLIGCGIAGGNWETYYKKLEKFAVENHCQIHLYDLNNVAMNHYPANSGSLTESPTQSEKTVNGAQAAEQEMQLHNTVADDEGPPPLGDISDTSNSDSDDDVPSLQTPEEARLEAMQTKMEIITDIFPNLDRELVEQVIKVIGPKDKFNNSGVEGGSLRDVVEYFLTIKEEDSSAELPLPASPVNSDNQIDGGGVQRRVRLMEQVADVLGSNVHAGVRGLDLYLDASKLLSQAAHLESAQGSNSTLQVSNLSLSAEAPDETIREIQPKMSWVAKRDLTARSNRAKARLCLEGKEPDSDDEPPPLADASESSDSETDDDEPEVIEVSNPRQPDTDDDEPPPLTDTSDTSDSDSDGGANVHGGANRTGQNYSQSGSTYSSTRSSRGGADAEAMGNMSRDLKQQRDKRAPTPGRDSFLDLIIETNSPMRFHKKNPYPSKDKYGKVNPRWAVYNKYKSSTNAQQAFKRGATRSKLRQDLNNKLIAVSEAMQLVLDHIDQRMKVASADLSEEEILLADLPEYALGAVGGSSLVDPYEITQEAADLEDKIIDVVLKRSDMQDEAKSCVVEPTMEMGPHESLHLMLETRSLYGSLAVDTFVPENEKQSRTCDESKLWLESEKEEFLELLRNNTFEVVKRSEIPSGSRVIHTKMVYRAKPGSTGELKRRKARFCAKGFEQEKYKNYHESKASVTEYQTVRTLLSMAIQREQRIGQLDVKNAFVSADLDPEEQVYLQQPKNIDLIRKLSPEIDQFLTIDGYEGPVVLKAVKSIYGLIQAPRRFFQKLHDCLLKLGFAQTISEECCYRRKAAVDTTGSGDNCSTGQQEAHNATSLKEQIGEIFLCAWVDDILIFTNNKEDCDWFILRIQETFKLSPGSGEEADLFLGMNVEIDRENQLLRLSGETTTNNLLHYASTYFDQNKHRKTPLPIETNLDRRYENEAHIPETDFPYRHIVGSLAHMARTFRPDLAHPVSELSRHLGSTAERHIHMCKCVLIYLNSTKTLGIVYHGGQSPLNADRIQTYCDADWAGDHETRKSRSGYVIMQNEGCTDWYSKAQPLVSSSSCESETISAVEALKTVVGLRILLIELGAAQPGASTLRVDNMALALNSANEKQSKRSKHFQIRTEMLRGYTRLGRVQLTKIHTSENISDLLTKILDAKTFIRFRDIMLGLTTPEARKMCKYEL